MLAFDASTDNMQRICYFYHVIQKVVITQDRTKTILCRSSGNLFVSLNVWTSLYKKTEHISITTFIFSLLSFVGSPHFYADIHHL